MSYRIMPKIIWVSMLIAIYVLIVDMCSSEGSLNQHVKLKHPDYVGVIIQSKSGKNTGDTNSEHNSLVKVIFVLNYYLSNK